jgi:F0F1-type ATP synthase assembly protein I
LLQIAQSKLLCVRHLQTPQGVSSLNLVDWRFVLRLGVSLLAFSVLPVILGILLDWRLHTSPIITLAMMLVGLNVGIVMITKNVAEMYARIVPQDTQNIGADQ